MTKDEYNALVLGLRPGNVKRWTEIKTWELELKCGHVVPYQGAAIPETVRCDVCDPHTLMGMVCPPALPQKKSGA